jgi:hypothetical protein
MRVHNEQSDGLTLSLFNNANNVPNIQKSPTTGLVLDVDLVNMTVTNLRTLADESNPVYAGSQGATQLLDNSTTGHAFMDYGAIALVREYDSAGDIIMEAQFGAYNAAASYRGYKYDWQATPFWEPAVVIDGSSGSTDVHMSWNGATNYDNWAVYGGPTAALVNQTLLVTVPRNGFETNTTVASANVSYIQAVARQGSNSLRASAPIWLPRPL